MKKVLLAFLLIVVLAAFGGFVYVYSNLKPLSTESKAKIFVVKDGDKIETITDNLVKNNLIRDKYSFIAYTFYTGDNKKLKSGNYRLSPSMSTPDIIAKLIKGGSHDYWLKIKDGTRLEEFADLFPDDINFTYKDFAKQAQSLEGYLYPDSYLVPQYFDVSQILDVINKNFANKISQAKSEATNTQLNDRQIVIFASLLEREGKTLQSKQMIAGILLNRLSKNMPLQLDATVQYARDSKTKPNTYWQQVTSNDLDIVSPYNTYKNTGIPPKPICNPGYNSFYAAYHPIKSDYIFYLTGTDGTMHYAKTLAEHNQNIQKYLR